MTTTIPSTDVIVRLLRGGQSTGNPKHGALAVSIRRGPCPAAMPRVMLDWP